MEDLEEDEFDLEKEVNNSRYDNWFDYLTDKAIDELCEKIVEVK